MQKRTGLLVGVMGVLVAMLCSCDIYESEKRDWTNDVTIDIRNLTMCPLDLVVDGKQMDRVESGESLPVEDLGQGTHFLEAYPWNDEQHSCDSFLTGHTINGDRLTWEILPVTSCNRCDPTPTPTPVTTPTPTPTPSA